MFEIEVHALLFDFVVQHCINKAIRDGKYLARHMPVLGNVHPIKIEENVDIFFVTSFLCSLELLFY